MKTLYISDLDRTLLNSSGKLSLETISVINNLIKKGDLFTIATGRSFNRSIDIVNTLGIKLPIIVYNGVFLIDPTNNKALIYNKFNKIENKFLQDLFTQNNIFPNVYSFKNGVEKVSLIPNSNNNYYLETRKGDKRLNIVNSTIDLYSGEIFTYLCMNEKSKLQPIYEIVKNDSRFSYSYDKEPGTKEYWLDITPKKATKAATALKLKQLLKCDKIITFGDGVNDIELFKIADECYAVENSNPEIKKIATSVIESNDNNGVAKWINENLLLH